MLKNNKFIKENLMGPNAVLMVKELLNEIEIKPNMKILDLGCGTGLSSIYIANNYDVKVFAVDLWISATDNYKRIKEYGLEDKIVPLHREANDLGFADNYFDLIISIDSYHYYGDNKEYLNKVLPLLKENGKIILGIPGIKEGNENIYEKFKEYIPEEFFNIYTLNWWLNNFKESNKDINIALAKEMACYYEAWNDWLATDNEYAIKDRKMFAETNELMNLLGFILEK